jgi:hypothetical protein
MLPAKRPDHADWILSPSAHRNPLWGRRHYSDHALAAFIHAKRYYTLRFIFAIMVGENRSFQTWLFASRTLHPQIQTISSDYV